MNSFSYYQNELYAEKVPVKKIAQEVGTPFYLYSREQIEKNYFEYDNAFVQCPHLICYALKANSNLAIGKILACKGAGVDIVSGGELYRALKSGFSAKKIVYAGVGKTKEEIEFALRENILMFNIESLGELELIAGIAKKMNCCAPIAIRVNPGIDPHTHKYTTTGKQENKFGIPLKQIISVYERAGKLKNIEILGMHSHIGSQIVTLKPFLDTLKCLLNLINQLEKRGIKLRYLNLGGGLGIRYKDENPPTPTDLARGYLSLLKDRKYTLILEPGRYIVGNAGILVTKVLYLKNTEKKKFVITDAGMTELIRPVLYDAYHEIIPVIERKRKKIVADMVGPICESADYFAQNRLLPEVQLGEILAVMGAGAYGFSMSSTYNSRPHVAEVLVDGENWEIIRERESYADLIRGEVTTSRGEYPSGLRPSGRSLKVIT